jgi:hypothetical protein
LWQAQKTKEKEKKKKAGYKKKNPKNRSTKRIIRKK